MVERYNKREAIDLMNEKGKDKTPFIFFIDYEMERIIVEPINTTQIAYKFLRQSNEAFPITSIEESIQLESYPIDYNEYLERFSIVYNHILRGDSYLVNLTFPSRVTTNTSLRHIYHQSTALFKGYIPGEFVFYSPEKFISIEKGIISTYPMKGTIDADLPNALQSILLDKKEMAEHSTIVDLLRNDLSQIASKVKVKKFRYPDMISTNEKRLIQISSHIEGEVVENWSDNLGSLLFALLPAGSISGAPKQKTMDIISKAEVGRRKYYTGICGIFDGSILHSGIMIRMLQYGDDGNLYYHSGGGITYKSDPKSEYQELIDKIYVPISRNNQSTKREDLQYRLS